jgi:hypothetical protein
MVINGLSLFELKQLNLVEWLRGFLPPVNKKSSEGDFCIAGLSKIQTSNQRIATSKVSMDFS